MFTIQFLSGECGSGKTTALLKKIAHDQQRYIYAAPTIKLIDQSAVNLASMTSAFKVFKANVDASPHVSVPDQLLAIKKKINALDNSTPAIIFVTHAAVALCDWSAFSDFNMIYDEISEPVRIWSEDFRTHQTDVLFRYLTLESNDPIAKVIPTDLGHMLLDGKQYDKVQATVRELLELATRPRTSLFAMQSSWTNRRIQKHFILVMEPQLLQTFKSVIMIGDDFENSLLFKVWSQTVNFEPLPLSLPARKMPLSARTRITYFSDRPASKTFFNDAADPLLQCAKKLASRDIEYWTCNIDAQSKLGRYLSAEQFAPPKAAGRNDLRERNSVAWLCASKPGNDELAIYESVFSLRKDEIISWREHNAMYQFIMRSALRDFDSSDVVDVYVFDREQAEYLADRFGIAHSALIHDSIAVVSKTPNRSGRKPVGDAAMTQAERAKRYRALKKLGQQPFN